MYLLQHCSIIAVICSAYIAEATKCISSETLEKAFYDALGCKSVFDETQTCPVKYDCSMIKKTSKDDCYFYGKIYRNNEALPDSPRHCRTHCRCNEGRVRCAETDCPRYGGPLGEGCRYIYGDQCCPEGVVCPLTSPFTCSYNNYTYLARTRFEAEGCMTCTCKKGFNGELVEPFCRKAKCDADADDRYYKALDKKCALLYAKESLCCPAYFPCADGSETITKNIKSSSGLSCKFGDHEIMAGDTVELKDPFPAICGCSVPPLLTCVTETSYYKLLNKYYSDPV